MSLLERVEALERAARGVPLALGADEPHDTGEGVARVRADLLARGIIGSALVRVPPGYYGTPLAARARVLGCPVDRLAKTIVLRNEAPGAVADPAAPIWKARHVAVVLQYVTRLDVPAVERYLRSRADPDARAAIRLVMAPDGVERTGFEFNAITPLGVAGGPLPVIVAKPIAALPPPAFIWFGGGAVDVKARVWVSQLLSPAFTAPAPGAAVVDCAFPRTDEEEGDGEGEGVEEGVGDAHA